MPLQAPPDSTTSRKIWVIDGGYLSEARRSVRPGYKFDYNLLKQKLEEEEGPVSKSYYFNAVSPNTADAQDAFHNWMRSAPPQGPGIITRLYPLKNLEAGAAYCEECRQIVDLDCSQCGGHALHRQQQKGVDVGMASLILTHLHLFDTLVLSSGDGDLLDVITHLSYIGKGVEMLVFKNGVSTELQSHADKVLWIDDFAHEVEKDF